MNPKFDKHINPYRFPLDVITKIPVCPHPGSFGAIRKHDRHTGVDLYVAEEVDGLVYPIEYGEVVAILDFTGEHSKPPTPYWNNTKAVLVEGDTGVIVYGEIEPFVEVGDIVNPALNKSLGVVVPVLKVDKGRPVKMLHIELLTHGSRTEAHVWRCHDSVSSDSRLHDPTFLLMQGAANTMIGW